ncbi:Dyp-type peroxidase [Penicillium cf. viridicatum]|uniref:Dyp-type peroxidase n=1 Tax=Penicillium cf. viridicatum TaxID=2972119 RepID=A0A9W9IPE7_9EURO|nr:Dyp-type peroxidase [Penicillium cf. viridicatum]
MFVGGDGPGIDAIVGQRLSHDPPRSIGLPGGSDPTEARMELDSWVIHGGGRILFHTFYRGAENLPYGSTGLPFAPYIHDLN